MLEKLASHDFTALTEGGAQWVRKALHPAESTIKAPRMPSHGVRPTATQETTMTFVVDPPSVSSSGTWSAYFALKCDPLAPLEIMTGNDDGTGITVQTVLNQAFFPTGPYGTHTPAHYQTILDKFRAACEQYRVTALSVTGTFVGATLSDQGSIISAQMSDPATHLTYVDTSTSSKFAWFPMNVYGQPLAAADEMILGTSPYVINVKEGFYVPYKMTNPHVWHRSDDLVMILRDPVGVATGLAAYNPTTTAMPYPIGNSSTSGHPCSTWLAPTDDGLSMTWAKSMARTSSFRITVRIAMEYMTRPDSSLASFCEPPALPDEHAIAMYQEIASRMKDAYPSKDNATGSLWSKIKSIASDIWETVSPALSSTPLAPIVPVVNTVKKVIPSVGRAVQAKAKQMRAAKNQKQREKNQKRRERRAAKKGAAGQLKSQAASASERSKAAPAASE